MESKHPVPHRYPNYRVIKPGDYYFGQVFPCKRTLPDGTLVLIGGRPWKEVALGFGPDEVELVEENI